MQNDPQKLRVAHAIETQPATFNQGDATEGATRNATASLKALARLALQGSKAQPKAQPDCNSGQNRAQLEPEKTPAKVAPVVAAIPEHPNSENSGSSTDPAPTPEDAAAMRLSAIESSGLTLLVKVEDGYMVWASTKARIPDEWAAYPLFTTEELRLIPPGNGRAARDWLALKRTFPGSTLHPVSATATPTTLSVPAPVTCATCKHFQATITGGSGDCAMHQEQRTTAPSERYPVGYPMQPALFPNAKRNCEDWEAL